MPGRLVFHANREGRHRLYTLDLTTGVVGQLTSGVNYHDEDAVVSPDGTRVAFTTTRFDSRTWDIAVIDTKSGDVRRVTTHLAFDREAAWSPDGLSLLFSSDREGTQAVFRMSLDTAAIVRVSPPPERALMPAASPDGRSVAYTMGTPDGFRLVVQNLSTGVVRTLTNLGDAAEPQWSPDGSQLAYTRLSPSGSLIEIVTLATGAVWPLAVEGLLDAREPAWSPDGEWIAVAGSVVPADDEDWDLVALRIDPPAAFRLTGGAADDRAPSWIPR